MEYFTHNYNEKDNKQERDKNLSVTIKKKPANFIEVDRIGIEKAASNVDTTVRLFAIIVSLNLPQLVGCEGNFILP
jgi:hypothetical protein